MNAPLYVIVRFELKADEFDTLIALIREFFEKEVRLFSGFISAKIHQNAEKTVLINYATWRSAADFQSFIQFAATSDLSRKIQAFNPRSDGVYEVPL